MCLAFSKHCIVFVGVSVSVSSVFHWLGYPGFSQYAFPLSINRSINLTLFLFQFTFYR